MPEANEGEPGTDPCGAAVKPVMIEQVTADSVQFAARCASRTGDPHECLRRSFSVPLSEVHTTPIKGAPAPVEMVPGAVGSLILSRAGWQATTPDGFALHGNEHTVFKLPSCAGIPSRWLSTLRVVPTSIVIRGHLEGDTRFYNFELLGPDAAAGQTIVWNSVEYLDVQLSAQRARMLGLKAAQATAKIWPVRLIVRGAPVIDPTVSGEVDLLDYEMADGPQHIAYAKQGEAITLCLSQDGVSAFHVTPQVVAERQSSAPQAQPCAGCAQKAASSH